MDSKMYLWITQGSYAESNSSSYFRNPAQSLTVLDLHQVSEEQSTDRLYKHKFVSQMQLQ